MARILLAGVCFSIFPQLARGASNLLQIYFLFRPILRARVHRRSDCHRSNCPRPTPTMPSVIPEVVFGAKNPGTKWLMQIHLCCCICCAVSAGDEAVDISAGAHSEARRQRGDCVLVLPPAALETGRRSDQPASVHVGRK